MLSDSRCLLEHAKLNKSENHEQVLIWVEILSGGEIEDVNNNDDGIYRGVRRRDLLIFAQITNNENVEDGHGPLRLGIARIELLLGWR